MYSTWKIITASLYNIYTLCFMCYQKVNMRKKRKHICWSSSLRKHIFTQHIALIRLGCVALIEQLYSQQNFKSSILYFFFFFIYYRCVYRKQIYCVFMYLSVHTESRPSECDKSYQIHVHSLVVDQLRNSDVTKKSFKVRKNCLYYKRWSNDDALPPESENENAI